MNGAPEMRRLVDEGGSDVELALLRSAAHDAPTPSGKRRTLVALGLGSSIVTATTATAASTTGLALLKWAGLAAIGSVLVLGGAQATGVVGGGPMGGEQHVSKAVVAVHGPAVRAATRAAQAVPVASADDAAVPAAQAEEPEAAKPVAKPVAKADDRQAADPRSSLAQEVASLDQAREALAHGDSATALRELEKHQQKFQGSGALGPEAMVLRIEAVSARGDRAATTALANDFLSRFPSSPHAARVRSLLQAAQAGR